MSGPTTRTLEDRVREIEDRFEIYNLIASHPPSADTVGSDHIAACWVEDGVFDRGAGLSSPRGREMLASQVKSPAHQAAIAGGLAHVVGLPYVEIDGDSATARAGEAYSGSAATPEPWRPARSAGATRSWSRPPATPPGSSGS